MRRPAILVIGMFAVLAFSLTAFADNTDIWRLCTASNAGQTTTLKTGDTYCCANTGTGYDWQAGACSVTPVACNFQNLWKTDAARKCCYDSSQSGYYWDGTGTCPGDSSLNPVTIACGTTSNNYMAPFSTAPGILYYKFNAAGNDAKLTLNIQPGTGADHDLKVSDASTWSVPASDAVSCGTIKSGDQTDYCPDPLVSEYKTLASGDHGYAVKRFSFKEGWFNTKLDCVTPAPPPPSCHKDPTVTVTPADKNDVAGSSLDYTVTVKNNDDNVPPCNAGESYTPATLGDACSAPWACTITSVPLTLSPGSSGTAALTVKSPAAEASGVLKSFTVTASIASPSHLGSATAAARVSDFTVTAPATITITKPSTDSIDTRISLTVASLDGFDKAVGFSGSWVGTAPAGVTVTYAPSSVTLPAGGKVNSIATITVPSATPAGTYTLKSTGTRGTKTHDANTIINIAAPTSCAFASASISACSGGTCEAGETITLKGYYGGVAASCPAPGASTYLQIDAKSADGVCKVQYSGGSMQGITKNAPSISSDASGNYYTGAWAVPAVPAGCNGKTAAAYSASLWDGPPNEAGSRQITATSTVSGSLVFAAPPDFTITAPVSETITKDAGTVNSAMTITVSSFGGFSSAVSLAGSWFDASRNPIPAPAGVAVSYAPSSVTPPAGRTVDSIATFTVPSTAPVGTYILRTTGTSAMTRYADTTVTINSAVPCSLSSASITNCPGGTCEKGETVPMTATFTGPCPVTGLSGYYLQIDAKSTDDSCKIEYGTGTIQGLTQQNPGVTGATYTGAWTVPATTPASCSGKTVYAWAAGLWNGPVGSTQAAGISDTAKGKPITDDTYVSGSLVFPALPVTSCGASSSVTLTLAPNPAAAGALVTPTVSAPTICSGKTAWVMSKSVKISSCVIAATGSCKTPVFPAPPASADYFAFIDLDNDGIMITAEPKSTAVTLAVVAPAAATTVVPACSEGAACAAADIGKTCCSAGKLFKCV